MTDVADTPAASSGPGVQIRFADGALVEFRPDGEWPRVARVRFQGVDIKGLRLDGFADIESRGAVVAFGTWKTDVAGADGGDDVPAKIRDAALTRCRKYDREAREAIGVVSGYRRAGTS